ncbi:MAG TPA: hypothetical protein VHC22_19405 [Pirellulales bacterium]|nr:hypothetical protein [Pirellulales bacterium]
MATDGDGRRVFELRPLDSERVATLRERPEASFAVYAVFDAQPPNPPPLAGRYSTLPDGLRFTPRFPLEPGMRYRAEYRQDGEEAVVEEFRIPARAPAPAARVTAIYPSSDKLPQNQLKFYVRFTAPMSRGDAYKHLELLDAAGNRVDLPFLELGEELWNPAGDRLTLLLDPARVKRGLKPREDSGPVLEVGRTYSLVIGRDLRDAAGRPLEGDFRKKFLVGEPDETCPQPRRWRLTIPAADTISPLVVKFDEPLDRALLDRMLWVVDGGDETVPGKAVVGPGETSWTFEPQQAWPPGRYRLIADTWLEDLAGNSIARKFELDGVSAERATRADETVGVDFKIGF